jgi:hypothetical protein
MLQQADQARDLAHDRDGQAVHTRVTKHSADPAPDAEEAPRGPSEAHREGRNPPPLSSGCQEVDPLYGLPGENPALW